MCRGVDLLSIEQKIKDKAFSLGFNLCGITKAVSVGEDENRFKGWLSKGFAADMSFLERNIDKRFLPTSLLMAANRLYVSGLLMVKLLRRRNRNVL